MIENVTDEQDENEPLSARIARVTGQAVEEESLASRIARVRMKDAVATAQPVRVEAPDAGRSLIDAVNRRAKETIAARQNTARTTAPAFLPQPRVSADTAAPKTAVEKAGVVPPRRGRLRRAIANMLAPAKELADDVFTASPIDRDKHTVGRVPVEYQNPPEGELPTNTALARALARGTAQGVAGVGGLLSAAGGLARLSGKELIAEGAETVGDFVSEQAANVAESEALEPSRSVAEDGVFQPNNPRWWIERGAEQIPLLATQLLAASATGGASAAGQIAAFALPAAVMEGGTAYNENYEALRGQGLPEDEARTRAATSAAITAAGSAALEAIPGSVILRRSIPGAGDVFREALSRSVVARGAAGATAEGVTEAAQEAWADVVQYAQTKDPDTFAEWQQKYMAAGALGAVLGAPAAIAVDGSAKTDVERSEDDAEVPEQLVAPQDAGGVALGVDQAEAAEPSREALRAAARGVNAELGGTRSEFSNNLEQRHGDQPKLQYVTQQHGRGVDVVGVTDEIEDVAAPAPDAEPRVAIGPGFVGNVPTADLDVEPERFQYKLDVDHEGVTNELKKVRRWDPAKAGVTLAWQDPADGRLKVVNGHHRRHLAGRLKVPEMLTRVIDAPTAEAARTVGALTNIAEGRGTVLDAAKVFRDTGITPERLEEEGVSLTGAIARDGLALSKLHQTIFSDVVAGRLPVERAAVIGGSELDGDQQLALYQLIRKRERGGEGRLRNDELKELIRFVRSAGETEVRQESLFGEEIIRQSLAIEKAELSAFVKGRLSKDRKLFAYLTKGGRADRLEATGTGRVDTERAAGIANEAARAEEVYTRLSVLAGPVSNALTDAARKLAAGESKHDVQSELYSAVRAAVTAELESLDGRSAARTEDAAGRRNDSTTDGPTDEDQVAAAVARANRDADRKNADLRAELDEFTRERAKRRGVLDVANATDDELDAEFERLLPFASSGHPNQKARDLAQRDMTRVVEEQMRRADAKWSGPRPMSDEDVAAAEASLQDDMRDDEPRAVMTDEDAAALFDSLGEGDRLYFRGDFGDGIQHVRFVMNEGVLEGPTEDLVLERADAIDLFRYPDFDHNGRTVRTDFSIEKFTDPAQQLLLDPERVPHPDVRQYAIPAAATSITSAKYDKQKYKEHPDFTAAKAGDAAAAIRFVRDQVDPATAVRAAEIFGDDVLYVAPAAIEASGQNAIPQTLARYYAEATGTDVALGIKQANRAFHTGADPMERLISPPKFVGPVTPGQRYVLVDDVTTSGSTLAALADHIQKNGGHVAGVITLANASRSGELVAARKTVEELERRFGDVIRNEFQTEPSALTADEAGYLIGFRNADELRARAARARAERAGRLSARSVQSPPPEEVTEDIDDVDDSVDDVVSDPLIQDNLFGEGTADASVAQRQLFENDQARAQPTLAESERMARATLSRLEPLVARGVATAHETQQYREALALLRRDQAMNADEVRLRSEPPDIEEDVDDGAGDDLFDDVFDPAQMPTGSRVDMPADPLFPVSGGPSISDRMAGNLSAPKALAGDPTSAPNVIEKIAAVATAAGREVPIRVGLQGVRRANGFYRVREEVIRINQANNIPTAAHELGHAIEKIMFGWPKGGPWKMPRVNRAMQKELRALGYALYGSTKPAGGYKREGWAEYVRMYITDTDVHGKPADLAAIAPEFTGWFNSEFSKDLPNVRAALDAAREETRVWREQGSLERAKQSIVDPADPVERARAVVDEVLALDPYRLMVESAAPLEALSHAAAEKLGHPLSPDTDPFLTTAALRSTHAARARYMVEEHMIDMAGNPVGPALNEIRALVKERRDDFTIYLWARRALKVWSTGRNPGISVQDAQHIIRELTSAKFELAAAKVYEWNDGVLNYAAQASPTFREVVERVRATDPGDYMPLLREFSELDKMWGSVNRAATKNSPVKRLKGSGRRIKDPFASMIAKAESTILAAHKRMVLDQLFRLNAVEGFGKFLEEVPAAQRPAAEESIENLVERINNEIFKLDPTAPLVGFGDGTIDSDLLAKTITFFAPQQPSAGEDPVVPFYDQGKVRYFVVPRDLYRSLASLDIYRMPKAVDLLLGAPARMARAGTTGLRASFGLIINPTRDVQTLYVNSRSQKNGMRLFGAWLAGMRDAALYRTAGKKSEWMDAFVRLGGEMSQPLGQDIPHTRRAARRLFASRRSIVLDPRNWYDGYRDLVQMTESAPRTAELRLIAEDIGWKPGEPMSMSQSLQLLLAAKQVTTDFTAAGEIARVVNQMTPFHNAAIQGPRANLRAAKHHPARFVLRGLQLTAATIGLWWLHKDEEWYKELTARDRFTYWHFAIDTPEPTLVHLPRSFEIGLVFSALPEALLDAAYRQDPATVTEWFKTTFEVASPPLLPVPIAEGAEQLANKDFFFNTPIVPEAHTHKPAEEQFNEYTTRVAIMLGELFNVSPMRLDHGIRSLFGPVGGDVLETLGLGPKGVEREKELADLPVVGRVFHRGGKLGTRPASIDALYAKLDVAQKRQHSDKEPETEDQRQQRLQLEDAAKAISALYYVRQYSPEAEQRSAITAAATRIARDAVELDEDGVVDRGRFAIEREDAEREKDYMKDLRAAEAKFAQKKRVPGAKPDAYGSPKR